jgi:phospholipid/cholesterol/gamma-HCH transport system substrate-binding protein
MLSQRTIESFVGLFLLAAITALLVLAFKVSGLTSFFKPESYTVTAEFDEIGQLKVRSPVKLGGVLIGEVSSIALDPVSFKAIVKMNINDHFKAIPDDSTVSILTAGLLGDNYIAVSPMYSQTVWKQGSQVQDAHSAMILEKLIGQLIYKLGNSGSSSSSSSASTPQTPSTNSQTTEHKK